MSLSLSVAPPYQYQVSLIATSDGSPLTLHLLGGHERSVDVKVPEPDDGLYQRAEEAPGSDDGLYRRVKAPDIDDGLYRRADAPESDDGLYRA